MIDIRDNEKNNQQSQNDNRNNQSGKNNPSKDADDENYNQQSQNDGRNNQSGKNNPSKDTDDENYNQLRNGNKGYHDDEQQNTDHKQDKGEKYVVDPNGDIIVKLLNAPDSDPDDQRLNRIPTDRENFLKRRIMLKNGQQMRYKLTK